MIYPIIKSNNDKKENNMKHKCRPLYLALCVAMASSSAFAVDFNGYVRAGTGIAGSGGGLQRGDEFHKNLLGRLGNVRTYRCGLPQRSRVLVA